MNFSDQFAISKHGKWALFRTDRGIVAHRKEVVRVTSEGEKLTPALTVPFPARAADIPEGTRVALLAELDQITKGVS